ncbi:hypothetical protein L195_g055320, partial [Trifolium pratense]
SDEDATSVDVSDSVSVTIVQDSDFATIEKRDSEFVFRSFSQDSEFEMAQMIPIETIKPSVEGRSIKIREMDCFLLVSESEPVAEEKKQESVFEDEELISYREESFSEEDEEFHPITARFIS